MRVPKPRTKARLNLTVNEKVYREAQERMEVLGMSVSGFVEDMLIQFLKATEPMKPLLGQEAVSERSAVVAMLQTLAGTSDMVHKGSFDLNNVMRDLADELEKKGSDTDK